MTIVKSAETGGFLYIDNALVATAMREYVTGLFLFVCMFNTTPGNAAGGLLLRCKVRWSAAAVAQCIEHSIRCERSLIQSPVAANRVFELNTKTEATKRGVCRLEKSRDH